jgi:phospholipid/cholesterol/gamma-HCH transport system ATP-binding protein
MNLKPIIQLIDVEKSFGGQKVLRKINLDIYEGKTTIIVGESGQGKSVILKHILGLVKPDKGKVIVDGKDITRMKKKELEEIRSIFGVLFQSAALFDSLTVFENVAMPLRERTSYPEEEIRRLVSEKLEMMGLLESIEKYPAQLSGGMQKRVGLARALQLNPKIMLFDEPTTGLDPAKTEDIYRLFYRTQAKMLYTAIIVSHDVPKIFKLADYIAVLHGGVIQEHLPPEELQRSSNPLIQAFIESTMGSIYSSDIETLE